MGLPVAWLLVATNVNDILHRALSAGDYSVGTVTPTVAPSMDIQVSSNFERPLFDLHGRDGAALEAACRPLRPRKRSPSPRRSGRRRPMSSQARAPTRMSWRS